LASLEDVHLADNVEGRLGWHSIVAFKAAIFGAFFARRFLWC
jgi:hypothetical protein